MRDFNSDSATPPPDGGDASQVASRAIAQWRAGQTPDAAAVLHANPHLAQQKSLVLDLAYEEYCLRKENGESVVADEFCAKFPDYRLSLARLLDVHQYLDQHPDFASPQHEAPWPQSGDVVLGFVIERRLGTGAFSRVYLAREAALGDRQVVVKLSSSLTNEAMTLGRLSHPGIVPVNSVQHDESTQRTAICMPYVGEATLVDLLDAAFQLGGPPRSGDVLEKVATRHLRAFGKTLDAGAMSQRPKHRLYEDAVAWIGSRVAAALAYAHRHEVLHRDIKPSNVLLTPDGRPMLLDFNLSWDARLAEIRLGGTIPYMSPEQVEVVLLGRAATEANTIDHRSDIFSLGVVLYELLTGVLPFGDGAAASQFAASAGSGPAPIDAHQLIERQRAGARSIESLNAAVSPGLANVVMRCLSFDRSQRPQRADEVAESLSGLLRPASKLRRWLSRHRKLAWSMAASVAIVATTTGGWLAARPAYAVRAYHAGLADYEAGDWDGAVERLSSAIEADRPTTDLLFARGMAQVRLGNYESALRDFQRAAQVAERGEVLALVAYCCAELRLSTATTYGTQALEKGLQTAAVYNNLGHSYLQQGNGAEAKTALDRAIELDPNLAEAYHNRALAAYRQALAKHGDIQPAIADIERAIELAPSDGFAYRTAVQIYAHAALESPDFRGRAIECLEKCRSLGVSLEPYRNSPGFRQLLRDPEFAKAAEVTQQIGLQEKRPLVLPWTEAEMAH